MDEKIILQISEDLGISKKQVIAVLKLLEEENTIPFIARYRKEATGGLDEVQINEIQKVYQYQMDLKKRKEDVCRLIQEKGMLTTELQAQIEAATKLVEVEDLYRPYKEKKKTKATEAIAKGLQPLADYIALQANDSQVAKEAEKYITEEIKTVDEAIENALYIIAENISDDSSIRKWLRSFITHFGFLTSKVKKKNPDEKEVYKMYYEYKELVSQIKPHRILALNRGENENVLTLSFEYDEDEVQRYITKKWVHSENEEIKKCYDIAIKDSLKRLIKPSVEREIWSDLMDQASVVAIDVFGKNAKQLFMQAPIKNKMVLGVDPAYRTGCKLAVVDHTGKFIDKAVAYPHEPHNQYQQGLDIVRQLIKKYHVEIIAIGNGTASRETEKWIAEAISTIDYKISYALVSEAGASVYSASEEARKEFPDFHVEERSAISIARRIIDPLAELVKIDPKSIGVGQYQHDVSQKKLDEELNFVVTTAVNQVGVDANTASVALLKYVSGVTNSVATNIVAKRDSIGKFQNREQLHGISRFTDKIYQQAIGFLRVKDGDNPLDATAIHPESYPIAQAILKDCQLEMNQLESEEAKERIKNINVKKYMEEYHVDEYTLKDIIQALVAPNLDPRDEFSKPLLKSDVLSIEDLKPNMQLEGTVRNIIDFGAFVDIGVKYDGLVHISKITKRFIKHPLEVLHVGQIVTVWVLDVDLNRKRISLTMINPNE